MIKNNRTNTNCMNNHKMSPPQRRKRPPPKRKCATIDSLPLQILETIFSYLKLRDIRACNVVCKSWNSIMSDENNEIWRVQCYRKIPEELIKSPLLRSVRTYKSKVRALCHGWNPYDCSRNIYVKANGFTLHRNPVAQSTDACRGKVGFREGRHAWEVTWEGPLGTVAVVGISTKEAALQCSGYVPLIGSDNQSWGWNLVDNSLLYNGTTKGIFPTVSNPQRCMVRNPVCHPDGRLLTAAEQIGERITVVLDCENKTLSFERNFQFLGVAFKGLPSKKFYPTVSAVYGNTEVSMVYIGYPLDG